MTHTTIRPAPTAEGQHHATEASLVGILIGAINANDEHRLVALFAPEAVIRDGGLRYHAPDAAACWLRESHDRYALQLRLLHIEGKDGQWTFEAMVSGAFEGSPVRLEHRVAVRAGKIVSLEI